MASSRSQPTDGVSDQRPLLASLLEPLLDCRNKVSRNVVANGAVVELEAFLDLVGGFGQRLEATDNLRT